MVFGHKSYLQALSIHLLTCMLPQSKLEPFSIRIHFFSQLIFSILFPTTENAYPFRMLKSDGSMHTKNVPSYVKSPMIHCQLFWYLLKKYNNYWHTGSWTFIFLSYNIDTWRIFGYQKTPVSSSSFTFVNFDPTLPLQPPNYTSTIWLGGTNAQTLGCRCNLAQVRFYIDLFVNDESLMTKFSDYGTGKLLNKMILMIILF